MVTIVRLQQLLPVASLGLLAALLAHMASYGSDHVAGGTHHTALELLALGGAGGFVLLVAALAALGASRHADGSILAAALRPFVPSFGGLFASATLWFALIESIEPEHAYEAPVLVVGLCLFAASALITFAAKWFVAAVAAIAVAAVHLTFERRPVTYRRRFDHVSSAHRIDFVYRRFARPPPGLMLPI